MAPTYITIYDIPINCIPINIIYPAAKTKVNIKYITEITGFLAVIVNTPDNKVPNADKFINSAVIYFLFS